MKYDECLQYLDRLGNEVLTMKFGLETIRRLLSQLGEPHRKYPSVLVAGTNGKGSVARFVGGILQACGYRTGLYTSPHLTDVKERIAVDGKPVSRDRFAEAFGRIVQEIRRLGLDHHPTYFETLTAAAFWRFSEDNVDAAVLEIGMGGRLDSTNVVDPTLSIITPISLDHEKSLGGTVAEIAVEKAGVIHPGRPVATAPQQPEALRVLRSRAESLGCRLLEVDPREIDRQAEPDGRYQVRYHGVQCRLQVLGARQAENAALAMAAAELLRQDGFELPSDGIAAGLSAVRPYAVLRKLLDRPALYIDGGHNPEAARAVAEFAARHTEAPRALVFGIMRDKQIGEILRTLKPLFETVFLTRVDSPRAAKLEELQAFDPDATVVPDPIEALRLARRKACTVVVTGSFYLAGEVASRIAELQLGAAPGGILRK